MKAFFNAWLLPGFVFMAVVIGGGYSTGRELVEFFGSAGPVGGLLGMLVTVIVWSAVLAISFELVRMTKSYDYQSFCKVLLGRAGFLFEPAYFLLLLVVLAVIGAAAGEIGFDTFGWPKLAGTLLLMALIALLVFFGSGVVEKVLAVWAFLLYALYVAIIAWGGLAFGERISATFAATPVTKGWFVSGLSYAAYNLAAMPAVYFTLRHATTRREAIGAGLLAGPIAMLPGIALFITMMAFYPAIQTEAVPTNYLLGQFGAPWFQGLFQVILFGIMVKTGTALLHAINERVAKSYQDRGSEMPRILRPAISLTVLVISVFAASAIGLVDLIAKGYTWLAYFFIVVLILPVLTLGSWKVWRGWA
jgi:uncharacterized membrane protein YkvI